MLNKFQAKAIKIAVEIVQKLTVSEGQTEKEIARWIIEELRSRKAKPAFRIIVASGRRSALPHGRATNKKIQRGELVVIDFGAVWHGYRSDITRTFVVGRLTVKQKKILKILKAAQKRAINLIKHGVRVCEVDKAARSYLEKYGLGKYFLHTTGHGIGRMVHEAPKISRKNKRFLKAGVVITIEPGVYIRGWGGARIEDMVLVTKKGCKILTR